MVRYGQHDEGLPRTWIYLRARQLVRTPKLLGHRVRKVCASVVPQNASSSSDASPNYGPRTTDVVRDDARATCGYASCNYIVTDDGVRTHSNGRPGWPTYLKILDSRTR
jgi:hypothetical protein